MYQQHSLDIFQRYIKNDTKTWFSPVRLIYSHSLIQNFISNRTGVNETALKIISQMYVWLLVRIKRKRFVFNRKRLFYFKKTRQLPCVMEVRLRRNTFQWKNLFIRTFLLKWKLLKHFWKRKKMGKHIQDAERLAGELQKYPYLYEKGNKGYKERTEGKCLDSSWAVFISIFMDNKGRRHTLKGRTFFFIIFADKFIIRITWNAILYHWPASPAINMVNFLFYSF